MGACISTPLMDGFHVVADELRKVLENCLTLERKLGHTAEKDPG